MQKIFISVLAACVYLTPLTVTLIAQPSWGETEIPQAQTAEKLLEQAIQKTQQEEYQQAIPILQQVLTMAQELKDQKLEATALLGLGFCYSALGEKQQALSFYNQALPLYRAVGDRSGEATTLNNIGLVYNDLGEKQQALSFYNQALPLYRAVGDHSGEATTLNNIGLVYNDLGEKQQALLFYNQALPLRRAVGDRAGEANSLNSIGGVYSDLGEKEKALSFYNQALPLIRVVGNRFGEATILNNIGGVYSDLGEKEKALSFYNQALPLRRAVGDRAGEANSLNNIGGVYSDLGEKEKALSFYNQALPLSRAVEDRSQEAVILNNIGLVYDALGQKQKALLFYNQSLPLRRAVGDRSGEARTLDNIGLVYSDLEEKEKALSFFNQALPLRRAVGDRSGEAITLNNIGLIYNALGEKEKALLFYNQALPLFRAVGYRAGEANTLNNIGGVYYDMGEKQKALDFFNKALSFYNQSLPLRRAVGDRSQEASTLSNRGILFQNTNRPSEAITDLEKSLQINLKLRRDLQQENRQKFLQQNDGSAIALVNVLIEQKKYDQAFTWVNLYSTADLADYNRLINAKVANPEAQKAIDKWNQKNQQLELQRQQLQKQFSEELAQKFRQLETQVNQEAAEISRKFPEAAELFETAPADIDKLKSSIPADTVVIQPVLLTGVKDIPNSLAIFILTNNKLKVIKTSIKPDEFDKTLTKYLEQLEKYKNSDFAENSVKLYDILIRPVEAEIQKLQPKQLSIIATGKLRYLPFETLYDIKTEQYLIEKYPVNYLTRISTSSLGSPKATTNQAPKVLAFGNPVPHHPQNLQGAETEVKEITNKLPGSEAYLHSKATLANFKSQALRFNFVHLATHGCFQDTDCTTLNLKNNSLLFADTQYNIADAAFLGLKGTQLLTLSACQTAKKIEDKGLGISGVAYIFERAGAKAVMAGLWSVDDKATRKLMVDFYANLQQGMTKGEALQKAKLQQIKRHPYYWSPFVIIGDAR
ncbi:tetratricopeptide repeat protein [Aulosira sp. FACHB-615]|uniref:CHAT domain-containing protein n=1 Tax=Aulosira sp. FACHB-615 TaxID=2692777 RepID=UPI001685165D|nr:tetratricopeptide repeat protein [Aulosira sp. FACHB-615]MBD2488449.1 tetratricopeptide repeat protein [Aulosira sp. FACHB-615]